MTRKTTDNVLTLKEFIQESLQSIVDAVCDFSNDEKNQVRNITATPSLIRAVDGQNQVLGSPFMINTRDIDGKGQIATILTCKFDVAVAAEETSDDKIGAGIKVLGIAQLGADSTEAAKNSSVSRVAFELPVQLPFVDSD